MLLRTEQKKITWRVPDAVLQQVEDAMRSRLPREQRSFQALLDHLVDAWLAAGTDSPVPSALSGARADSYTPAQRRMLADVSAMMDDEGYGAALRHLMTSWRALHEQKSRAKGAGGTAPGQGRD